MARPCSLAGLTLPPLATYLCWRQSRHERERRLQPGRPIRWARPGTARASTSRSSRRMRRRSSCASSIAGAARSRASRCPSTPTRSGTATCRTRGPACSTAIASTAPTIRAGHRFNPNKLLLDPYARRIAGTLPAGATRISATRSASARRSLTSTGATTRAACRSAGVVDGLHLGRRPTAATALERHRDLRAARARLSRCTHPAGRAHAARHLRRAAPAAVIDASEAARRHRRRAAAGARLRRRPRNWSSTGCANYWGYNTIGFFAPDAALLATRRRQRVQDAW